MVGRFVTQLALWKFKQVMLALGADPEDMAPGSQADPDDIISGQMGAPCRLSLKKIKYHKKSDPEGEDTGEKNDITEVLADLPF